MLSQFGFNLLVDALQWFLMTLFENNQPLVQEFREGRPKALALVYRTYVDEVFQVIQRGFWVGDASHGIWGIRQYETQKEMVQEVFTRAYSQKARLGYDGLRPYRPILLKIARRLLVEHWRALGREIQLVESPAGEEDTEWSLAEEGDETPAGESLPWQRGVEVTKEYLSTLDPEIRAFAQLRFEESKSQYELVEVLRTSRWRVRALEKRALLGLEKVLQQHGVSTKPIMTGKNQRWFLSRLLSGRDQLSVLEKEEIFSEVLRRVSPSMAPAQPQTILPGLRKMRWVVVATALGLTVMLFLWTQRNQMNELQSRGAGSENSFSLACLDVISKKAKAACQPGDTLVFSVRPTKAMPYFAAFSQRGDKFFHWYFQAAETQSSLLTPSNPQDDVLVTGVEVGAEHLPGLYQVYGLFSQQPLSKEQIQNIIEHQRAPLDPNQRLLQRELVIGQPKPLSIR